MARNIYLQLEDLLNKLVCLGTACARRRRPSPDLDLLACTCTAVAGDIVLRRRARRVPRRAAPARPLHRLLPQQSVLHGTRHAVAVHHTPTHLFSASPPSQVCASTRRSRCSTLLASAAPHRSASTHTRPRPFTTARVWTWWTGPSFTKSSTPARCACGHRAQWPRVPAPWPRSRVFPAFLPHAPLPRVPRVPAPWRWSRVFPQTCKLTR